MLLIFALSLLGFSYGAPATSKPKVVNFVDTVRVFPVLSKESTLS